MNITIPTTYNELSLWQLKKVILFFKKNKKLNNINCRVLFWVLLSTGKINFFKKHKVLKNIDSGQILPFLSFLLEKNNLTDAPKIKGFKNFGNKIANLTIHDFSLADYFCHHYIETKNEEDLNNLFSVLYRKNIEVPFLKLKDKELKKVKKISTEEKEAVLLYFQGSRDYLYKCFPRIPKGGAKSKKYQPIDSLILSMVKSETNPFGTHAEACKVNVYLFFKNVEEEFIRQKKQKR